MNLADIEKLAQDAMAPHGCHTVILYGSWARGDATEDSDVDVLGVRAEGTAYRDARFVDGKYLDGFVYLESSFTTLEPAILRVRGGKVLVEQGGFGTALLARIQELHDRGPEPMAPDERRAVVVWSKKMVERFRGSDALESRYRRMQLFQQSLEDYFALRGAWFEGPKAAFAWLAAHDAVAHARFERAAADGAPADAFRDLVASVYGPFAGEAEAPMA